VIVANADQLAVVTAVTNPEPRPRLIDRCLVAAYDAGLEPLLVVTKTDLDSPDHLLGLYRPLGVAAVITQLDADLTTVRDALRDRITVLVGHSGVGKSTLVNALVPAANRAIGAVNIVTGRGRHTSTSAVALLLPFGGWVIDTPGLRSFGLAHVRAADVLRGFGDLSEAAKECPRGCTHLADAPDCALDDAVARGQIEPARLESFRRVLASQQPDS
jgi:ribosome biogenesis GTPase